MLNKTIKIMIVKLNYWAPVSYTSCNSEIKDQIDIESDTDIGIFEQFYQMNNKLRYCNGHYFEFFTQEWRKKYAKWLNSADYKAKSFNLYYGNGTVD